MKRVMLAAFMSLMLSTTAYGNSAHEQTMSFILADQDIPEEPGDVLCNGAVNKPVLMATTGYYEGSHGSHGDLMKEGYVAGDPDLYGASVSIYKAVPREDGEGYQLGEFLGIFEMKDTGYGYSTGEGTTRMDVDRKYAGSIESGIHLDVYRDSLGRCWDWMHLTDGMIFAVIVPAKG